jgi:hypothetical protein
VAPFTKRPLNHSEVTQGPGGRTVDCAVAIDAAAAAAEDVNMAALNRDGIRELAKQSGTRSGTRSGAYAGMRTDGGGFAQGDLGDEDGA